MVLLADHLSWYLKVYPKKSNCVFFCDRENTLVFCGESHKPLSFKNSLRAGLINLFIRFLLLAKTIKSSAYLTTDTVRLILSVRPSLSFTVFLCSFEVVIPYIDFRTFSSKPLSVKLANVGDMIPPCGVPVTGSVYLPLSKILALNHFCTIPLILGCKNKFCNSHSWLILSKNPLISASSIHLS